MRSVEVTPFRSQNKGVEMTRLEARVIETESQNQHSCQLTVLAVLYEVQSSWPVQCDRTSEGFWRPVVLARITQRYGTSEVFWKKLRNPPDTVGVCRSNSFTVLLVTAGPEEVCCTRGRFSVHRTARPQRSSEIHSSPSDCRPEEACCTGSSESGCQPKGTART